MITATFKKEDLQSLVNEECDTLDVVEDRIIDTSRWSVNHTLVFKDRASGKFYAVAYSRGATEQQYESPFEYEADLVECEQVRPVEKTIIAYESILSE